MHTTFSQPMMSRNRSNSCPPTSLDLEPVVVRKSDSTSEPGCDVGTLESLAEYSDIHCESSEGTSMTPQEPEPETMTHEQLAAQQVEALKAELAALQSQNQKLDQFMTTVQSAPPTPPRPHGNRSRGHHRQHAPAPIVHTPHHMMGMPPMGAPYMYYTDSDPEQSPYARCMPSPHFQAVSPVSPHNHQFPQRRGGRFHQHRQGYSSGSSAGATPEGSFCSDPHAMAYGNDWARHGHMQFAPAY